MRKLVKTIKKLCSDVLMHTPVVFKGIHLIIGCLVAKDNRD
jgi:hypothetical protein